MPTHPSSDADNSPSSPLQSSGPSAPPSQELWRPADPARFREMLARVAASVGPPQSPAMRFGAYVAKKELDAATGRGTSAFNLAQILRLDPVGKAIEKLEAADLDLRTRVKALEADRRSPKSAETLHPASVTKSRRGRRSRAAGLDCTGQMLTVLREDRRAAVFTGRMWEKRLKERFGEDEGFCRKTIESQRLYKKHLRPALVAAQMTYGPAFEADFLEDGLELWSYKPGRGDKRKDHTEKQALAGRVFMAALENATIEAERSQNAELARVKREGQ
jgi:hypothetical protein